MPNVLSYDAYSANAAITANGLVVGTPSTDNNCVDPGTVQEQNPNGGTHVLPGSTVTYSLSTCTTPPGDGNPRQPK